MPILGSVTKPDDLLSTKQAAEIIGCERSSLTRWVQLGRIEEAHKIPGDTGARLFRRSDVEALRDEIAEKASAS